MDNDDANSRSSGAPRRGRPPKGSCVRADVSAAEGEPASASPDPGPVAVAEGEPPEVAPVPVDAEAPRPEDEPATGPGPAASVVAEGARPGRLDLAALKEMAIRELAHVAKTLEIPGAANMKKQELVFQIRRAQA